VELGQEDWLPRSLYRVGRWYRLYTEASARLPIAERKRYTLLWRCYIERYHPFGYDTVIRLTWVRAADSNFAFKIAARPLQIETWLLLTAWPIGTRHRPIQRYHRRLTPYDVRFSHNICITDRHIHTLQCLARTSYHNILSVCHNSVYSKPSPGDQVKRSDRVFTIIVSSFLWQFFAAGWGRHAITIVVRTCTLAEIIIRCSSWCDRSHGRCRPLVWHVVT